MPGRLVRFRPIMMTTMAALMGTLPIALGFGAGAESRRPLGSAVVGGLLISQLLTLYITPVFYLYMESFQKKMAVRLQEKALSPDDVTSTQQPGPLTGRPSGHAGGCKPLILLWCPWWLGGCGEMSSGIDNHRNDMYIHCIK